MARLLALADDLTGALEVGAKLGAPVVLWDRCSGSSYEVLVVDTESRHLDPADAAARVRQTVAACRPSLIFKKTDSTLRGNIGAELAAIGEAAPDRRLVFLPAYPELGRTVRNGHLYVDGQPLHLTPFAQDPHHPALTSSVQDALQGLACRIEIHDAESEDDVARSVAEALACQPTPVLCGPANVAGHLGRALGLTTLALERRHPTVRCLVVNGSMHQRSAAQIEDGAARHWPGWSFIAQGHRAAQEVARLWARDSFDTLVVFGGDTAFSILEAIGWTELTSLGEIAPGVPVSRTGALQLVTKAGGFGPVDVLSRIRDGLTRV